MTDHAKHCCLEVAGLTPLFRKKVTASQLAKSIKSVAASPEMDEKAKEIGAAMAGENGVQTAVKLISDRFNGR